ncbi:hypothetical protein GBA63_07460 [Rubrobacter tropicus]|uniref:Uncharacterized protein n=1 Tax=Rubrobacter tropicus TaxID=2653851 RepID=A0A6G8Q7S6_9ACTN|nr:hypothetical protein [Rubrobacter tropicus]QIN82499.1 hypothetical protein GBA63_07460 [Rubrobacter tropicus]
MDRATQYLEDKISEMDRSTKLFENAMKRRPVADNYEETAEQALVRLRAKHRPPKAITDQDVAAQALADYGGK